MKWEGGDESGNVEDRRGLKPMAAAGGIGGLVLMAVVYFLTGDANIAQKAGQIAQQQGAGQQQGSAEPINDKTYKFAKAVLGFTDVVWTDQFRKTGRGEYEKPVLVLFNEQVQSGCGVAPAAVGPFYCPADHKLYYDPSFFDELEKLGGSKAEFSQAYVIAHEVGHHVQNLTGYSEIVDRHRRGPDANDWSVRLELQADYLAGVWAHYGQEKYKFLESGDIESAIKSATAIGDDKLQKRSQGWVSPEKFTHGTSEQRAKMFQKGFQTGDFSKAALDAFMNVRSSREL